MTSLPIFLRPRVDVTEIDLTQRIRVILSTTAAVVGEFERGPVTPQFDNGPLENFLSKYGSQANPQKYGFAHDTVTSFRRASSNTLITRVVGAGAKHAGASVIKQGSRLINLPFIDGSAGGYTAQDIHNIVLLEFAGDLITANSFKLSITDGATSVDTTPVVYATSHNATMTNIAAAIQSRMALSFAGSDGSATVYQEPTGGNNKIIIIRPPRNKSLTFFAPLVTLGATQTTATVNTDSKLFDLFTENPGAWGNEYGYKLTNFDGGTRQRIRLTFSQALVNGNIFNMAINGVAIDPITFSGDSDTTLAAIAAEIQDHADVVSATVETTAGAVDNDRSIVIVAQVPGPNKLVITNPIVSAGASQAIVVPTEVLKGIDPEHTFTIEVFKNNNLNKPVERFKVSFRELTSSLGAPLNAEQVINKSSKRALNIRIAQTALTKDQEYSYFTANGSLPTIPANVAFFTGGDDGVAVTSADIRAGWNLLQDRVIYPANILLNAGYSNISVMQTMVELARKRSDCLAILDCPFDKLRAEDFRLFRLEELNIDDSNGAIYGPYVEIEDEKTGVRRLIPPSGPIGAVYADNDKLTKQMGSPFGLNRGKVRFITGLSHYYNEGEQELLHPNQCNFIIDKPGVGPVVMSERTLQYKESILQAVHARRILNLIKVGLADNLEYVIGDNNTKGTRYRATSLGDTLLKPIKKAGGLYDYKQRCNEINNTPDVIDAEVLAYDVYLQIVRVIRGVALRTILTRTGVKMEEVDGVDGF